MVFTRSQIENLSREELIEEVVKFSDIPVWLNELTDKFDSMNWQISLTVPQRSTKNSSQHVCM